MSSMEASAKAQLGLGGTQAEVTGWFQQQLLAALADPLFNIPKAFETWVVDRVAVAGLNIPIGQIVGFMQAAPQVADTVATGESTPSTSFTDLATVGPELTGLPDGQYLFLYGCRASNNSAGSLAEMAIKVNATEAAATDAAASSTQVSMSVMRAAAKTLSNDGNNTVTARYQANAAGTATFRERWLIALKIAN
jgi:hypothetical protein